MNDLEKKLAAWGEVTSVCFIVYGFRTEMLVGNNGQSKSWVTEVPPLSTEDPTFAPQWDHLFGHDVRAWINGVDLNKIWENL